MTPRQFASFSNRIVQLPNGCWETTYSKNADGYTRMGGGLGHRVAYAHFVGPIPAGADLDHLCRNRACVNPTHVEPVAHLENVRRGKYGALLNDDVKRMLGDKTRGRLNPRTPQWQANMNAALRRRAAALTHCKHGHERTDRNVGLSIQGKHFCRVCYPSAKCHKQRTEAA